MSYNSRVSNQNGVSLLYIMLELNHSCQEPSICSVWTDNNGNGNNNNNNDGIQKRYSRFFTISSEHCELSPIRTLKWPGRNGAQITCNTLSAYHVQVSCYVPLGTKGQLSY